MKPLFFFLPVFMVSCLASRPLSNSLGQEIEKGKSTDAEILVVKKDGSQITPASIKFRSAAAETKIYQGFMWVDGVKMDFSDVSAWQTPNGYNVIVRNDKSKNGIEMKRLRHGKINLYFYEKGSVQSGGLFYIYYFNKGNSEIQKVDYEAISKSIGDDPKTLALLQALFPKRKIEVDINGEIYDATKSTRARLSQLLDSYNANP